MNVFAAIYFAINWHDQIAAASVLFSNRMAYFSFAAPISLRLNVIVGLAMVFNCMTGGCLPQGWSVRAPGTAGAPQDFHVG